MEDDLFEQGLRTFTASRNTLRIDSDKTSEYLKSLSKRVSQLSGVLSDEDDAFVVPYLEVVKNSLHALELKHQLSGVNQLDFSFTIDPTSSGFPTIKDLLLVEQDKKCAKRKFADMPSRVKIVNYIRKRIFDAKNISHSQAILREYNYYSEVMDLNVFKEFHLGTARPVMGKDPKGNQKYTLQWSCIERGKNVPVLYRMYCEQNGGTPLHKEHNATLETILRHCVDGIIDLRQLIQTIDESLDVLHPKQIQKYVVGPFYHPLTEKPDYIEKAFEESNDPSILAFHIETIMSVGSEKVGRSLLNWSGTTRQKYDSVNLDNRMIVPFDIKQSWGNKRNRKLYGFTKDGEYVK